MNPDKLFDYLDDKLPDHERHELEQRLVNDAQARRELDVARRIHAGMRGGRTDCPEVFGELAEENAARGRRLTRQVGVAALVLVALNVLLGLLYIAHQESRNPNRELLDRQSRDQLQHSLEKAAADSLTPPPLGVAEATISVQAGDAQKVADEIVSLANRLGVTVTKGVPDPGKVQLLVELQAEHAQQFTESLRSLPAVRQVNGNLSVSQTTGKLSLILHVEE